MARRVLYSGVATTVHEVRQDDQRALLYVVVDPESGDHIEILLNEDQAREDGRALAAPPGRLPRGT